MSPEDRLAALRRRIDVLDRGVVRSLARRLRLVRALRPFKSRIFDPPREAAVLANVRRQARRSGADGRFVESVYSALLRASLAFQKRAARG